MRNLKFIPLEKSHFPLLLKWLEMPHVKKWWDSDIAYTMNLVSKKYSSYIKGYKEVDGENKPIQAFIIYIEQEPIGYIQIYNAYDFPRCKPLLGLPENLGSFDIFIGEEKALHKNLGSRLILEFFKLYAREYLHIFVDHDSNNIAAIKCYEKAGFKRISKKNDTREVWMLKELSLLSDF